MTDDILDEVRRARLAYGEQFGFDLDAICRDLEERSRRDGLQLVSYAPRQAQVREQGRKEEEDVVPRSGMEKSSIVPRVEG